MEKRKISLGIPFLFPYRIERGHWGFCLYNNLSVHMQCQGIDYAPENWLTSIPTRSFVYDYNWDVACGGGIDTKRPLRKLVLKSTTTTTMVWFREQISLFMWIDAILSANVVRNKYLFSVIPLTRRILFTRALFLSSRTHILFWFTLPIFISKCHRFHVGAPLPDSRQNINILVLLAIDWLSIYF